MNAFERIRSKLEEWIGMFSTTTAINALKNGVVATLPLTMLGSIFLLISAFPITGWNEIMTGLLGESWKYPFTQISSNTFDIIAMASAASIGYQYAKLKGVQPFGCSLISMVNFLVLIPSSVTSNEVTIDNVISKTWVGGRGMVAAIIVALLTGWIYTSVFNKGWRFKMPDSVPEGVSDTFNALIPGFISLSTAFVACAVLHFTADISLAEVLSSVLQAPLQIGLGSLPGMIVMTLLTSIVWWFGIHASVVNSIANPILRANGLANQALLDAGIALTVANGAYLVTYQTMSNFVRLTGTGCTGGLVLAMVFFAKSKRYRTFGRLTLLPQIFTINEPVIFGFPVVLNFGLLIPMIIVPLAAALVTYFALLTGLVHPFAAVEIPWAVPPIISGFIVGGWRAALLQVVILFISFAGYYPFFRKLDAEAYRAEQEQAQAKE